MIVQYESIQVWLELRTYWKFIVISSPEIYLMKLVYGFLRSNSNSRQRHDFDASLTKM